MEFQVKGRSYIEEKENNEVERISEDHGYEVLYNPPYKSDLKPIELVWDLIKGNFGQMYDSRITLDSVYESLIK